MNNTLYLKNLGCDMNRTDGEKLLASLEAYSCKTVNSEQEADCIIINTCGFIQSAKEESLDEIFNSAKKGKKLVIAGCMGKRYQKQLQKDIPEADLVLGLCNDPKTLSSILSLLKLKESSKKLDSKYKRIFTGLPHSVPIKIAEGCNCKCTFCAIPAIRGKIKCRNPKEILAEAKALKALGVKELIIVAQNTTAFKFEDYNLSKLLKLLAEKSGIEWIRLMYAYPSGINKTLIDTIKNYPNILPYLDIPIQHASPNILKKMARPSNIKKVKNLLLQLRDQIPNIRLRTTLIVGFPGETINDFNLLHNFIKEIKFDRLGAFAFSPEDGTKAFNFKPRVNSKVINERINEIMITQNQISWDKNEEQVGKTFDVLIDGYDESNTLFGRTFRDAPEVDGKVLFKTKKYKPGSIQKVKITGFDDYDLFA